MAFQRQMNGIPLWGLQQIPLDAVGPLRKGTLLTTQQRQNKKHALAEQAAAIGLLGPYSKVEGSGAPTGTSGP